MKNKKKIEVNNIHCLSYAASTNLGDEVQTLAALHILKKIGVKCCGFIDRDNPQSTEKINLFVNGFIPQTSIYKLSQNPSVKPIFNNFHIAQILDRRRLGDSFKKLKPFSPIGCRDRWTTDLLKTKGIDAFFNHCLTLTFDRRTKEPKNGKIFMVDLDGFIPLPKEIKKKQLIYITHESVNHYSHKTKMSMAQELLNLYRDEASLVITSKLHCALPCVAMGIPVILFGDHYDPRLKLAEEVIPIHPYVVLDDTYTRDKLLPYILKHQKKIFKNMLEKKIKWHIKYRKHLKHNIDWDPQPIDIEHLKKKIINNTREQIEKLAR